MAKINTNLNASIVKALDKKIKDKVNFSKISSRVLKKAADDGIKEIKKFVSKGISPLKGEKRFSGYKNPVKGYPTSVKKRFPGKKSRPVNLTLSGKFLKMLTKKIKTGKRVSIKIGFFDSYGKKLESGHREGVGGQPLRPIIPIDSEEFKPQIINAIKDSIIVAFKKAIAK